MKKWLQRIRGVLGMGLTWALGWLGILTIVSSATGGLAYLVGNLVPFAVGGFIAGAAFSVVLGIAGGRRRFDEMSLPRFAGWGAVGGLLTSGLLLLLLGSVGGGSAFSLLPAMILVSSVTLLTAGSAAGSLALARRADDRELLDAGADVADIGLTEEEKRELLAG